MLTYRAKARSMRDFTKYDVWKASHELTLDLYILVERFPADEKYRVVSQVLRAAYSIPANFAEGCGKASEREFNRYIQMALGSAHELEYFMILVRDLSWITSVEADDLIRRVNRIKMQLYALGQKLNKN